MSDTEREIAQRGQEKFQFYFLALTFTILGLSIQTAEFGGEKFVATFEVLGWFSLLLSGLAGLSFVEWNPEIRYKLTERDELKRKVDGWRIAKDQGLEEVHVLEGDEKVPIDDHIKQYDDVVNQMGPFIKNLEKKSMIKYKIFKWGFFVGVLCIAVARSYIPITTIIFI